MTGSAGWAGEVGHVCVDPDGPACRCGSTGCLEQYAGRHALLAAAGLPLDTPPAEVVARASAGDADVRRALDAAARALGVALAGVVNVLDLPAVVLGRAPGCARRPAAPPARGAAGPAGPLGAWRRPVVAAVTGPPAAGATGAALRALGDVLADPVRRLG
jgi:predicted NBD/HSP70 family sugar kinase